MDCRFKEMMDSLLRRTFRPMINGWIIKDTAYFDAIDRKKGHAQCFTVSDRVCFMYLFTIFMF